MQIQIIQFTCWKMKHFHYSLFCLSQAGWRINILIIFRTLIADEEPCVAECVNRCHYNYQNK